MYKRYSKILKKTKEDSSSESESVEEQETLKYPKEGKSRANESSDEEDSEESIVSSASEESDGIIETETLTIDELEAGDDAVARKPKRDEVLLYQCSICPEKELTTLKEVKVHIESKFHMKRYQLLVKHGVIKPDENPDAESEEPAVSKSPAKKRSSTSEKKSTKTESKDSKKKRGRAEMDQLSDESDTDEPSTTKMDVQKPLKSGKKGEMAPPATKKQKSANGNATPVAPAKAQGSAKKVESAEEREARYAAKRAIKLQKRASRQEEHAKMPKEKSSSFDSNKTSKSKDTSYSSKDKQKSTLSKTTSKDATQAEKQKTPSKSHSGGPSPVRKIKTPKSASK